MRPWQAHAPASDDSGAPSAAHAIAAMPSAEAAAREAAALGARAASGVHGRPTPLRWLGPSGIGAGSAAGAGAAALVLAVVEASEGGRAPAATPVCGRGAEGGAHRVLVPLPVRKPGPHSPARDWVASALPRAVSHAVALRASAGGETAPIAAVGPGSGECGVVIALVLACVLCTEGMAPRPVAALPPDLVSAARALVAAERAGKEEEEEGAERRDMAAGAVTAACRCAMAAWSEDKATLRARQTLAQIVLGVPPRRKFVARALTGGQRSPLTRPPPPQAHALCVVVLVRQGARGGGGRGGKGRSWICRSAVVLPPMAAETGPMHLLISSSDEAEFEAVLDAFKRWHPSRHVTAEGASVSADDSTRRSGAQALFDAASSRVEQLRSKVAGLPEPARPHWLVAVELGLVTVDTAAAALAQRCACVVAHALYESTHTNTGFAFATGPLYPVERVRRARREGADEAQVSALVREWASASGFSLDIGPAVSHACRIMLTSLRGACPPETPSESGSDSLVL